MMIDSSYSLGVLYYELLVYFTINLRRPLTAGVLIYFVKTQIIIMNKHMSKMAWFHVNKKSIEGLR